MLHCIWLPHEVSVRVLAPGAADWAEAHCAVIQEGFFLQQHLGGAAAEGLRRASHNLLSASHTLIIHTALLSWLQRKHLFPLPELQSRN